MDRRTFVTGSVGALAAARVHGQAQLSLEARDLPSLWDVDRSVANRSAPENDGFALSINCWC